MSVEPLRRDPDWITGPFTEHRVVIDGRMIPSMTARREGDRVSLILDDRLSITVPADIGYQVAAFAANAMAIGAGYSHSGATTRERPFASECAEFIRK